MRILHTADWHLGKIVNNVHMTEDQAYILSQFIQIVKDEQPDVVVIAGDLYDRSIPPKEAVELLNKILTTLIADLEVPVLAIAGNHDSPDRLEFGSELFRKQQLYLETKLKGSLQPVTLHDSYGPVHFHLIPYIEPADARQFFNNDEIGSHQSAMEAVVEHIEQHHDMGERHVFVGHMFLAGGMESESEERLSMIGGTPYVDVNLFKKFTYVALGHLHQPQRIAKDSIRYSGSILKYSFSEAKHKKSVTIVDIDEQGKCDISQILLPPRRDMIVLESYFDVLMNSTDMEGSEDYLHVSLLDDGQLLDPMGKLRKKFPNILRLERKVLASKMQLNDLTRIREKQKMTHAELFEAFYKEMKGDDIPEERKNHMTKIVHALMEEERGK